MMFRTTLKAGQFNSFNGTGRHFYLVTAADKVVFKFLNKSGSVQFQSEFREGMSVDFPAQAHSVVVETETAQYIEFWFGDSKLDYMSLAAGGAAANIQAGQAWAPLGAAMAIPGDFRRKKITIKPVSDVAIGGLDIDGLNGYKIPAGQEFNIGSRGDIYTYVNPAIISKNELPTETRPIPWNVSNQNSGKLDSLVCDYETQNLICSPDDGVFQYSADYGQTWVDSDISEIAGVLGSSMPKFIGQTDSIAAYLTGSTNTRIVTTANGGKSFNVLASNMGLVFCYGGYVSPEMDFIAIAGRGNFSNDGRVSYSFDGGKSWQLSPPNIESFETVIRVGNGDLLAATTSGLRRLRWIPDLRRYAETWELAINNVNPYQGQIASYNEHVYAVHNGTYRYLYHSDDYGQTWTNISTISRDQILSNNPILMAGKSLLIGGDNRLGVIEEAGGSVVYHEANTPDAERRLVSAMCVVNGNVLVKQGVSSGGETVPFGIAYPVDIVAGRLFGTTIQWLAELN